MPKNLYDVVFQRVGCAMKSVKVIGQHPGEAAWNAIKKLDDQSYDALTERDILSITRIAEDVD